MSCSATNTFFKPIRISFYLAISKEDELDKAVELTKFLLSFFPETNFLLNKPLDISCFRIRPPKLILHCTLISWPGYVKIVDCDRKKLAEEA